MRGGPASWVAVLAMAVIVLVSGGCGRHAGAPAPAPRPAQGHVATGVRVGGQSVGGMTASDAAAVIRGLAADADRMPRDAYVDPNTHGLVPGVAGVRLNVAATLREVLAARRDADLSPITESLTPAVNLSDLPPAPIYNGSPTRPEVAFVINVAWGEPYIPGMLRTLAAERAPVTFCLVGRWAEAHPDLVRAMVTAGQHAGTPYAFCNHGYRDHGWALLSQAQAYASITAADRVISGLTGASPLYFSPHRGEFNPAVLAASRRTGHDLVLWSLDTIDWKNPPAAEMRERIVSRAKAGDIVLMHPTAPTEQALAGMIQGVRAKGLKLVTLDTLLASNGTPGRSNPVAG